MVMARCPLCGLKTEVQDEDANSVQCSSCGHTIYLGDFDPKRIRRQRRAKRRRDATPIGFFRNHGLELLGLAIPFLLGLCLVPLPFLHPAGFMVAAGGGGTIFLFAFITDSVLCAKDGDVSSVPTDLNHMLRIRALLPFILLILLFYLAHWSFIHVTSALAYPRKFLPWLALQVYGILIAAAAVALGVFLRTN